MSRVSEATLRRVHDYAANEPSFTIPFAAWETGLSGAVIGVCVETLHSRGLLTQIEPARGPYAATYAYAHAEPVTLHVTTGGTPERELHDRRVAWVTEEPA